LLEPQRTNLFEYSEQLDNAYWSKVGSITITPNTEVSPDGFQNADLATGGGGGARIQRAFTGLTAGSRTLSCFVKAGTGTGFIINTFDGIIDKGAEYNLSTGVVASASAGVTATIVNYGNGWYRLSHTYTSAGTSYSCQFFLDNVGTYRVWGFQFEDLAAYPTSYIPTLGSSVTRLADTASKTGISSLIGQTAGTLYLEFNATGLVPTNARINLSDETNANWVFISIESNKLRGFVRANGVNIFSDETISPTANNKVAIAYQSGSIALYINGVQILTDASTFTFSSPLVQFGTNLGASNQISDAIVVQATAVYTSRLSNAELASLTSL
jgi:hypothetical protein